MHKLEIEIYDDKVLEAFLEIIQNLPVDKIRILKLERGTSESKFSTYKSYSSYKQQMNDFLDDVLKKL